LGQYSITAEVSGFKKKTVTGVVLEVNQNREWTSRSKLAR